jgi:hypothetical protein
VFNGDVLRSLALVFSTLAQGVGDDPASIIGWINALAQTGVYGLLVIGLWAFFTKKITLYSALDDEKKECEERVTQIKADMERLIADLNRRLDAQNAEWEKRHVDTIAQLNQRHADTVADYRGRLTAQADDYIGRLQRLDKENETWKQLALRLGNIAERGATATEQAVSIARGVSAGSEPPSGR